MVPNGKGFTNRFQLVRLPKVSDLFMRMGLQSVVPQSSGDEYVDPIGMDKNSAADYANYAAENVPPASDKE